MTRDERLAQTEARAKAKLDADRKRLAQVQAQQRAEERKALAKRRMKVGMLADQAGLLVLDNLTLAQLFALLTPLVQVPNPVAVLESLLSDPEGPALEAVTAPPSSCVGGVGPCRANLARAH